MLRRRLTNRHEESIPSIINLCPLSKSKTQKQVCRQYYISLPPHATTDHKSTMTQQMNTRTISSNSPSSSLRSSISCTRSRMRFIRPVYRPPRGRGMGWGCGGRGSKVGKMRGRGRSVGVVTDMVHSSGNSVSTPDVYSQIHELRVLLYRAELS